MGFFVILRVATVVVVLLHAMDDFHVAALEPDAEQAGTGLVQRGKQFAFGADVGAAVCVERQLLPRRISSLANSSVRSLLMIKYRLPA